MINLLLTLLLASLFLLDWLFFVMGIGGRVMTWIPEFIAIIVVVTFPFKTAIDKQVRIPFKYLVIILVYVVHILMGFAVNDITEWTMLAGLRIYTKFLPIFLLPMVFPLSDKAFRNVLLWLYALTMVQLPVVLWQRFIQVGLIGSGDPVGGTLGMAESGILAIYMISVISFLVAFYFKDEISLPVFLFSALVAFLPVTMNETKISSVLLPIAFVFPAFFIRGKRDVIFKVLFIVLLLVGAMVAFKITYDYFSLVRGRAGIIEFWSDQKKLEQYNTRRIDPVVYAFTVAPRDDIRFAVFGRGAGNVSVGFTKVLSGKYLYEMTRYHVVMTLPQLIWEIGFLGAFLFYLFPVLVFLDAVRLCRRPGMVGAYALGMLSFAVFFVGSTAYTSTINNNPLMFLFFFASGQLVALLRDADARVESEPMVPVAGFV